MLLSPKDVNFCSSKSLNFEYEYRKKRKSFHFHESLTRFATYFFWFVSYKTQQIFQFLTLKFLYEIDGRSSQVVETFEYQHLHNFSGLAVWKSDPKSTLWDSHSQIIPFQQVIQPQIWLARQGKKNKEREYTWIITPPTKIYPLPRIYINSHATNLFITTIKNNHATSLFITTTRLYMNNHATNQKIIHYREYAWTITPPTKL